jgi:penicillin G amidase
MILFIKRSLLALLALVLIAMLAGYLLLRGSLPQLDGERELPGLSAPVSMTRDGNGVLTVTAGNDADMARALGFVHAQERYFEMDLLRRSSGGELSELFGKIAVEKDKSARVHRLRARIREHYAEMAGNDAATLQAYADGVNAGLAALKVRPWPYLLLNSQPKPWMPEDSFLIGYAMFFDLQDEANDREFKLWQLRAALPQPMYNLLTQTESGWDAPLFGDSGEMLDIPSADEINLHAFKAPMLAFQHNRLAEAVGSNNFAVAGNLTADGRAIVANDMHLGLRAPNIWYRARLRVGDSDINGFTLPGLPAVIVGSNKHVAWGFTNSYGDFADFVAVRWVDANRKQYLNAQGITTPVKQFRESIAVKGEAPVIFDITETEWGPVTRDIDKRLSLALMWVAQRPGAMNFKLNQVAKSRNLDEALLAAESAGIPGQNLLIGDSSGRIAWRLTAKLPNRVGDCDKTAPLDPQAGCGWDGWLAGSENPRLVDPSDDRLWTANNRVVSGQWLELVGNGGYALGARAQQIRDGLEAKDKFTERDLLAIQTDDRALFLERWHKLLGEAADDAGKQSALHALYSAGPKWDGKASTSSVSYRMTRGWRLEVSRRIESMLLAPAIARLGEETTRPGPNGFDYEAPGFTGFEDVAWALIEDQPENLLTSDYASWDDLLEQSAETVRAQLQEKGPLAKRTWGERNTAAICHPLAGALPKFVKSVLCMPADQLPGDGDMPLVASPTFGASERMVVSPGHEAEGIIHMPGGQSGHFLSPFWGAGHEDWVKHNPTPFLPGKTEYTLTLKSN